MYLPPGSTLLRLLQLPLSLSNFDRSAGHSAVLDEDFNDFGNLSPYHDAPTVPGVSVNLPSDCTVDQVILLHRHGSRGPAGEQDYIHELVDTLDRARDVIQAADLPPELEFLKEGYEYQLDPEQLTIVGRRELFDHGVKFGLRYPTFSTDVVVSTTVQRVIDSAHFFAQGLFGREAEHITFSTTDDCDDCGGSVSWLDTWKYCPNLPYMEAFLAAEQWAESYISPIVDRLNKIIPGVEFTLNDIRGALYACPYDLAARNNSPWCNVFTTDELRGFEYEIDLLLDGITGHGASSGDPGPLVGAIYIKKLIERLTDETGDSKPLYLDFAHDFTVLFALSTMGLNKDALPLTPYDLRPDRKFRSSHQAPFAANMVWEKFTCEESFEGPQVRLLLNGVTLPLTICEKSETDMEYGTCSLKAFKHANQYSMDVEYESELWDTTCLS